MDNVQLRAKTTVGAKELTVQYSVLNQGAAPIYVFDVAFGRGATLRSDFAEVAYQEPETALLASRLLAPPPGTAFATPPKFYATRVAPGATYDAQRVQPLPLRTTPVPFAPPPAAAPGTVGPAAPAAPLRGDAVTCRTIKLVLGMVRDTAELAAAPEPAYGASTYALSASAVARQELVAFEIKSVNVTLER